MTTIHAYIRVSTDRQAESGLGLDAQRDSIRAWLRCQRVPDEEVAWHIDAGRSGCSLDRPELQLMLGRLQKGDRLVVAKLDRLSRSLLDFAGLLERSQREGWAIAALDLGLDLSTPTGQMVASVLGSIAQWEARIIGERTASALAEAKKRGRLPGKRSALPRDVQDLLIEMDTEKRLTLRERASWLNDRAILTATGLPWTTGTIDGSTRSARLEAAARAVREEAA